MRRRINLNDVKELAYQSIEALKEGKMNVQTAAEIRNNLNVIVEVSKTEIQFINAIPKLQKEELKNELLQIASTVYDANEAELNKTLLEINSENERPYEFK